jgi:hypothetical protein
MQRKTQLLRALRRLRPAQANTRHGGCNRIKFAQQKDAKLGKFFRITASKLADFLNLSVATGAFFESQGGFFATVAA